MMDEAELSERMERTLTRMEDHFAVGEAEAVRMAARDAEQLARDYGSEILLCGISALLAHLEARQGASPSMDPA